MQRDSIINSRLLLNFAGLLMLCAYCILFLIDISPYWFSPDWVTDDAMQQVYQFHEVSRPGIFNDIITESMSSYLAPLHYWLCYSITWLTGDPLLMAHWMMLIQIALTAVFLFLCVNHWVGIFPASMAALWFLHSGILIQRLAGGLPRGWISPFIAIYLYLAAKRKHKTILLIIMLACLTNSLAALVIIASYSFFLFFNLLPPVTRRTFLKPALHFVLACPVFLVTSVFVVSRPAHIGKMVTYKEALRMPALSSKHGRFKIAPLPPATHEFRSQAFQIFSVDYQKVLRKAKPYVPEMVLGLAILLCLLAIKRRLPLVDSSIVSLLAATLTCYFAARMLAFNLYVPNRYIRFPVSLFLIVFFIITCWKLFHVNRDDPKDAGFSRSKYSLLALVLLATLVYVGTGSGLQKEAGYNYHREQDGHVFAWLRKNTPEDSVIAGYPNFMDPVPLFAMRKVYISNETAHPFYDQYYKLVKKRLKVTLSAHYAKSLRELYEVLKDQDIDYFVFERKRFYPDELRKASYFAPFDKLVKDLTRGDNQKYAFRELPVAPDLETYPYFVFTDTKSAVIDVKKLTESFREGS